MEPASKRMKCFLAANMSGSGSVSGAPSSSVAQPAYTAPATAKSLAGQRDTTCHVGPRGGTYIITASWQKYYSGC